MAHDEKLKLAIKALSFYADPDTYFAIGFLPDRPCGDFMEDFEHIEIKDEFYVGHARMSPGKLARKTLMEIQRLQEEKDEL